MKKWEYHIKKVSSYFSTFDEDALQILDENGWELVSVVFVGDEIIHYFKREVK